MKFFDKINRYGMEIVEEDGKYYLSYLTGDHIGSVDTLEISKEDAEKIKDIYTPLDGMDIRKTEEGRKAIKAAASKAKVIVFYYKNNQRGLPH